MNLNQFIDGNPARQYVLDFLRDSMWSSGDLPLVRKVTSAMWDELQIINTTYKTEAEALGWDSVKLRLINAWKRDISRFRDINSVLNGELMGLSPDVTQMVQSVFPSIKHYGKLNSAQVRDQVTASTDVTAIPLSPEGLPARNQNHTGGYPAPKKDGSNRSRATAAIVVIALVAIAATLYLSGPTLLPLLNELLGSISLFPVQNSTPDTTPPLFTGLFPANGSSALPSSAIVARYAEDRSINLSSVAMSINGTPVIPTRITQNELEYQASLDQGHYTVFVSLADTSGNSANVTWSFDISSILEVVADQVLEEINSARVASGMPPVAMADVSVATAYRSQDMMENSYFNHYDLNGYLAPYYYTSFGGIYAMEENIGYLYSANLNPEDVPSRARNLVHDMIYDDASSNWGHRDSLLDPTNNFVDISAAWNGNQLFLTVQMIKQWVNWTSPPRIENGIFFCSGRLLLANSSLKDILVYFSDPSDHNSFTYDSRLHVSEGESSYSLGDLAAGVIPLPYYYQGIETIRPITWSISGNSFSVSFRTVAPSGSGIYTISIMAKNTLNQTHPYDPSRYSDELPIAEYSVLSP
ncbi:MAG: hypothetical protein LUP94_01840 [Candidatus Methanomethylicus sp.]|nr:hypothetical protein [Candidatus Methanomethylicus sp.]